jgi:hypothetical protein
VTTPDPTRPATAPTPAAASAPKSAPRDSGNPALDFLLGE